MVAVKEQMDTPVFGVYAFAWAGFWFASWVGIVAAGATTGLLVGGLYALASIDPNLGGVNTVLTMTLAGGGLAGVVGAGTASLAAVLTLPLKPMYGFENLTVCAGAVTGLLCGAVLLPAMLVSIPLGAAGAWLGARLFMRTALGDPLKLPALLRAQKLEEECEPARSTSGAQ